MHPTAQPHEPIERYEFDAAELMAAHPPALYDANKKVVFDIACPPGCAHRGRVALTRWSSIAPPEHVDRGACVVESRDDVYNYVPMHDAAGAVEWHVNFADPQVFGYYGTGLMAQDETQCAEHPVLASLREALQRRSLLLTKEEGKPTPILVTGAERRCCVAQDVNPDEGRPNGLYGNEFEMAEPHVIARATRAISPPTVSNIIAIAAPSGGRGWYQREELAHILDTAYTGFRAAVLESARVRGTQSGSVVIHSGFWGCGAFGGNREVMTFLQIMAAKMAGVERLVLHTVDPRGFMIGQNITKLFADLAEEQNGNVAKLLARLYYLKLRWGVSDGN